MIKSLRGLALAAFAAITFAGCSPVVKVSDAEVGIRETFSGEIKDKVLEQGFHQKVVGNVIKVSKRNLVLTVETNPITVEKVPMSQFVTKINYGINPAMAAVAYKTEKSQNLDVDGEVLLLGKYVSDITDAAVQTAVSKYKALEVNDHRTELEAAIKSELNKRLKLGGKDVYVTVNEVNILAVKPHASIIASSLAIVNSQNALKTKQNELETAKVETEVKRVLAENASEKYIDLQRAEAEMLKSQALLEAAKKGTLNTMVVVPEKFSALGNLK